MAKATNPFIVTGKIEPEYFCDRVTESARLVKSVTNGNNMVIISPRRMGKTGLIQFCYDKPEIADEYYTFFIDILHTSSLREFTYLLGREIYETLLPRSRKMTSLFIQTIKSISGKFGFDPITGMPTFNVELGDIDRPEYTLDEIWDEIITYSTETEKGEEHYFEVEMFEINKENTDLLNENKVREYLSFVVPVPYKNTFILRSYIYDYAKKLGYKIDEYRVRVNGSQIFKEYTTKLKEQSGANLKNYDEISRLEFKDFRNSDGNLIAWMWIGLSRFEKQIPKVNTMRGLRVRSANIQLGNDDTLQDLFKENRGNYYFVGEVFAASKDLIPNSQRDYFNENETRVLFEDLLREYFFDVLHKLYYEASRVKNDYKRQEEYLAKVTEYQKKEKEQGFVNEEERQKLQFDIDKAKKTAEDARKRLDKLDSGDANSPLFEVRKSIGKKYSADRLKEQAKNTSVTIEEDKKKAFVTSNMSKLSRSERKIVSKILSIINEVAPKDIAEQIIEKIKEEMR